MIRLFSYFYVINMFTLILLSLFLFYFQVSEIDHILHTYIVYHDNGDMAKCQLCPPGTYWEDHCPLQLPAAKCHSRDTAKGEDSETIVDSEKHLFDGDLRKDGERRIIGGGSSGGRSGGNDGPQGPPGDSVVMRSTGSPGLPQCSCCGEESFMTQHNIQPRCNTCSR